MILTSRSQKIACQDTCPRFGFLSYLYRQREDSLPGLQGKGISIPLLTGGQVHNGLAMLLRNRPLETAVRESTQGFLDALQEGELILNPSAEEKKQAASAYPDEIKQWTIKQELALIEGFLRAADKVLLPGIRREWEILEVEREGAPLTLGSIRPDKRIQEKWIRGGRSYSMVNPELQEVLWQWRPDGVLLKRGEEPELVVLSFKTSSGVTQNKILALSKDNQSVSESWALGKVMAFWHSHLDLGEAVIPKWYLSHFSQLPHPPRISGTQLILLDKGRRMEDKATPGKYVQYSPLIRGYKQEGVQGLGETSYAWSWDVPKVSKAGSPYMGVLGNSYKPFHVWEEFTVAEWIEWLASGNIQPECGDALAKQFVLPSLVERDEKIIASWERQLVRGELESAERAFEANSALRSGNWEEAIVVLDRLFPQHLEHCVRYGSLCSMDKICAGPPQVLMDPIGSGLYRERRPHHELEEE